MRDRPIIAALAAVLVVLAVAACGGGGSKSKSNGKSSSSGSTSAATSSSADNGVSAKSANEIVSDATTAINGVSSVRVSGSVGSSSKDSIKLDLHLVAGKGATGSMSENGLSFKLITVGNEAYINGSPSFWKRFAGPAAVQLLQGKWLRAPSNKGDFASFSSLTDLHKLLSNVLSSHGALAKGATSTINGQKVIGITDKSKKGTLYVATTGKPYPLQIASGTTGGNGGELDFSEFNAPVTLKAPAQSIDITKLKK